MSSNRQKIAGKFSSTFIVYCILVIAVCFYCTKKQAYNWDILPYMGLVLHYNNSDINSVHHAVYKIAQKTFSKTEYKQLTDTANPYRKSIAESPEEFRRLFPLYAVKPLYTGLCWLFYKAGSSLSKATVLPSVLSYFFIAVLLFTWIRKYHSALFTFCVSMLLMLTPPFLLAARLSTPDCLSALLLFAAIYYMAEKKQLTTAALLLLVSVLARPDNILPAALLATAVYLQKSAGLPLSLKKYLLFISALTATGILVSLSISGYGWSFLYYPDFIQHLSLSGGMHQSFSLASYFNVVNSQLMTGLYYTYFVPYLLLCFVMLSPVIVKRFRGMTFEQTICLTLLVTVLTRFILQPAMADRFYLAYYLTTAVFLLMPRPGSTGYTDSRKMQNST
jgi:uncharacterized membrane protein YhaH (DUF805 family)